MTPIHFLQTKPRVVATIHNERGLAEARYVGLETADFLEFRADCLSAQLLDSKALKGFSLPIIVTVRSIKEGGHAPAKYSKRVALFLSLLTNAQMVDIEVASRAPLARVVSQAQEKNLPIIMSAHDFVKTPPIGLMRKKIDAAAASGAALCKIATTLHTTRDLCRLLQLLEMDQPLPLSLMGMGKLGKISRPLLAQAGSCLNYGYLDKPLVPGQWPAARLKQLIQELET